MIPHDCGVSSTVEARQASCVRVCSQPIISYWLVRGKYDRVSLPCKDPEGIDKQWRSVFTIGFDDGQIVSVNGEPEAGLARHPNDSESIPHALFHVNYAERHCRTIGVAAFPVYQRGLGGRNVGQYSAGRNVEPMRAF